MGIYDYDYYDYLEPGLEAVAGFFAVFALLLLLIVGVFAIVTYILHAIGLQTIAKRRGIHHSYLAWIPIGSAWLLGSISDQYQYVAKRNETKHRTALLVLSVVQVALCVFYNLASASVMQQEVGAAAGALLGLSAIGGLVYFGISVVLLVFPYIALYDLYNACDPSSAVLKLVFSIIFSVTIPFFVFASRKKDLGMPARKTAAPVEPVLEALPTELTPEEAAPVDAPAYEDAADPDTVTLYPEENEEKPDTDDGEQPE